MFDSRSLVLPHRILPILGNTTGGLPTARLDNCFGVTIFELG